MRLRRSTIALGATVGMGLLLTVAVLSDEHVRTEGRVSRTQPANLTRTSTVIHGRNPLVLSAYEIDGDGTHGDPGTFQPGLALYNANSGALSSDEQINIPPHGNYTVATSGAGHDAPAIVRTANDDVLVTYGAISTYAAYHPPEAWHCAFAVACQPFKIAHASGDDERIVDELASSPEYLLPTVGISELSFVTIGGKTLIGGQQQPASRGGQPGAQGYVAFDGRADEFETANGLWNYHSGAPPANGLSIVAATPPDDAYVDFAITNASPGAGDVRFAIGSASCNMSISSNGSAQEAAGEIARSFSSACAGLGPNFGALQVQYDPAMRIGGVVMTPAVVGITARESRGLPPWSGVSVTCSGSISCGSAHGPNTVADARGSGLHRHFLFGGLLRIGRYAYYLMDVEQLTGSWLGRASSDYGLALACFRTAGGSASGWTWTDCAGRNAFTLRPGNPPEERIAAGRYTIPRPARGFSGSMLPYVYDWSMRGQAESGGFPVIAAVSATQASDGSLVFVHGCQTREKTVTVCYARYDPNSGETRAAGTIAQPPGGALASVAVRTRSDGSVEAAVLTGEGDRWGCGAPGICFMTYRYLPQTERWVPLGRSVVGGEENAGFPGTVTVDDDKFVVQMHYRTGGSYRVEVQVRS